MRRKGVVASRQTGQQFLHCTMVQPDAQVDEIAALPAAVVIPSIEPGIDLKRGRIFLPDWGQVPVLGSFNISGLYPVVCQVFHYRDLPGLVTI